MIFTVFSWLNPHFQNIEKPKNYHTWSSRNFFKLVNWKGPGIRPMFTQSFKIFSTNYISTSSPSFNDLIIYDAKDVVKCTLSFLLFANTCHATNFTVDGMVRDTKHYISRERSITFIRNFFICTSETKFSEITFF